MHIIPGQISHAVTSHLATKPHHFYHAQGTPLPFTTGISHSSDLGDNDGGTQATRCGLTASIGTTSENSQIR